MIKITSDIIKKINKVADISSYISIVVDYAKEQEYVDLNREVWKEISSLSSELTPGDIDEIQNSIESYHTELYVYTVEEILKIFYPGDKMLYAAIEWMDTKNRIPFLLMNGHICANKYLQELLYNVNDNYIVSPIELSFRSLKMSEDKYRQLVTQKKTA